MSTADGSAPAAAPTPAEPHTPPGDVAHPRAIRTFVMRAGRTTIGQARALAELGNVASPDGEHQVFVGHQAGQG